MWTVFPAASFQRPASGGGASSRVKPLPSDPRLRSIPVCPSREPPAGFLPRRPKLGILGAPSPPIADFLMGLSKTEVNLRRLLAAAPQQQNKGKLIHSVTTLRELLEKLGAETTSKGKTSSKAKLNEYSEKIEGLVVKLAAPVPEPVEVVVDGTSFKESPDGKHQSSSHVASSPGLRLRTVARPEVEDRRHDSTDRYPATAAQLNASTQAHIEKHRKLQEDLADEMVGLAQQLKESSLTTKRSLQETEKILDSTEGAVERSLASTSRTNTRAMEVYLVSTKTTCFTWLVIFVMACIFVMVVLLIHVT